jgi:hypothetical protein
MQVAVRSTVKTMPGVAGMAGDGMGDVWSDLQNLFKPLVGAVAARIQTQPGATLQYDPRTGQLISASQQVPGYPILTGTVSGAGTLNASPGSGTLLVLAGVAAVALVILARR